MVTHSHDRPGRTRRAATLDFLASIGRDLRHAFRSFRGNPGFVIAFIMTFALGVGVNTTVFSVVNSVVFQPLPVEGGDRMVVVARRTGAGPTLEGVSYPDLEDIRSGTTAAFDDVAGYQVGFAGISSANTSPARVLVTWVTGNYFSLLGVTPALGRLIEPGEGLPGRWDPIVVLGHSTWERRFASDPEIIGKSIRIGGRVSTIVGIAPPEFSGTFAFSESELFLPLHWMEGDLERRDEGMLHVIARRRSGVTPARAQANLDHVVVGLRRDHPEHASLEMMVLPERFARPLEDQARTNVIGAGVMLGIAGLVLLVAMMNVINLLLARASARSTELAIRAALGAGRGRLVQQLLTETVLLGIAGGAVALLLSHWSLRALGAVRLPGDLPIRVDFTLDVHVVLFATAVTLIASFIAGAVPAIRVLENRRSHWLRAGSVASGSGAPSGGFVAVQTAACLVLLVTTGLFVGSLRQAEQVDLGFRPDGVLNVHMDVSHIGLSESAGRIFFAELERRVREIQGVADVSYAATVPLGYLSMSAHVEPASGGFTVADRPVAITNAVGPAYFATLGVPIVQGRGFSESDDEDAPLVAIVNQRLAATLWPNEDPINRRFSQSGPSGPWLQVVGVTPTGTYRSLFEDPRPAFYVPIAQHFAALRVLHVRSSTSADGVARTVEEVIRELQPDLPLYDVQSMTRALETPLGYFLLRTATRFAGVTGLLALILSAVGLGGLVSYTVTRRRHEFGIRLALGARPFDIATLVLWRGLTVTAIGVAAGLAFAVAGSSTLDRFLYRTSAQDPVILIGAALLLMSVAASACLFPARRAARADPLRVLRCD